MSNDTEQQQTPTQGNAILTEKEVQTQQQNQSLQPAEVQATSSINTNAEENGQPVYTSNDPLMQPPTEEQKQQLQSSQKVVMSAQQQQPDEQPKQRSNTAEEPPNPTNNLSSIDATIQGLYIQILALQHNKIQQITGNNNNQ